MSDGPNCMALTAQQPPSDLGFKKFNTLKFNNKQALDKAKLIDSLNKVQGMKLSEANALFQLSFYSYDSITRQ